jgi:hypothetical protein
MTFNGPLFVKPYRPDRGGVDFLGLRQVNIDMMAGVLPGINNVTWWIRPFSVVSWIYWKFYELAARQNISQPSGEQLRVWKEKVETLFTWSHKLEGLQGLPGISFNPPASGAVPLEFQPWGRTALNTSLMAAIQYGPAAKTLDGLGFLEPETGPFFRTCAEGRELAAALDFNLMAADVTHLLSSLAPASATPEVAHDFYPGWAVSSPTARERAAFRRAFFNADEIGKDSAVGRRSSTVRLIQEFVESATVPVSQAQIREGLFHGRVNGSQISWKNPDLAIGRSRWQVLQIRQLQRIGIEALLSWFEFRLQAHLDRDTDAIARRAEMELASATEIFPAHQTVGACLQSFSEEARDLDDFLRLAGSSDLWNPPTMVQALRNIVESHPVEMVAYSLRALFICARFTDLTIKSRPAELHLGGAERVSLVYLRDTLSRCSSMTLLAFLRHVFENLILSQHFSVAARRFDGATQRLRISIEEEGLAFLADSPLIPSVTLDRLATALSLMADCGLLKGDEESGYLPTADFAAA